MFLEANSLKSTGQKPKLKDSLTDLKASVSLDFSIRFEIASSKIKGENSFLLLNEIIDALKNRPKIHIEIIGHTDKTGTDNYNNMLSLERAKSVKKYLINAGINISRIKTKGMGEQQPKSDNPLDNRRVEIVFSE